MKKTDVVIVGAGAVGCAVARELSKYEISVIVVDQNEDVGGDASKSNSAIIHTGYDAAPGTLESQLVVAALCTDRRGPTSHHRRAVRATAGDSREGLP